MSETPPIVRTNYGPVKGRAAITEDGFKYLSFQGIPYIKQPVGDLRYRDPQSVEPWTEVFDATKEGPVCYASDCLNPYGPQYAGEENALVLNVYTPSLKPTKPLPVYVWIHGGGFMAGSSSTILYGPDYLIEHDMIVVSFNYRLSVQGFLSFRDPAVGVPGNAGLKDQSMALRWVKQNIAHFGGDPENITLAGESAGGGSVHYHLISPMSAGLFNRAIVQSGSVFGPWASVPVDSDYGLELAKALGWNGEGGDVAAFKVISESDIKKVYETADTKLIKGTEEQAFGSVYLAPFLPKVEAYESATCFLPHSPLELGRDAWSNNLDVIIGGTADEGLIFKFKGTPEALNLIKTNPRLLVPCNVRKKLNEHEAKASGDILRRTYFWRDDPTVEKFVEYQSDHQFWHGIWRHISQRYYSGGTGKTFTYYLANTADPELKVYRVLRDHCVVEHLNGTSHADDLALVFKSAASGKPKPGNISYEVFNKFQKMYASFIKAGDPNCEALKGVKWYPHGQTPEQDSEDEDEDDEGNTPKCMKITDNKWEMVKLPVFDKMMIWDALYEPEDLI